MLGVAAIQRGDFERAIPFLHRARNSYPRMPGCTTTWGWHSADWASLTEAQGSFRTALLINPRFVDAHVNLADVLTQQRADWRRAFTNSARAADRFKSRRKLQHAGQHPAPAEAVRRSSHKLPAGSCAESSVGTDLAEHGQYPARNEDFEAAATAYQEAMRRQPKTRICLLRATLEKLGQPEAAEAAYREALKQNPAGPGRFLSFCAAQPHGATNKPQPPLPKVCDPALRRLREQF